MHIYYSDQLTWLRNICYNFAGVKASGEITIFAWNHCLLYVTWCKITGQESHNNYHLHQYLSWKKFTGKSFDFFTLRQTWFFCYSSFEDNIYIGKIQTSKHQTAMNFRVFDPRTESSFHMTVFYERFSQGMKINRRAVKPLLACWYVTW